MGTTPGDGSSGPADDEPLEEVRSGGGEAAEQAWSQLYERARGAALHWCRRLGLVGAVDDIVQDAILKLLERCGHGDVVALLQQHAGRVCALLNKIVHDLAIDRVRARGRYEAYLGEVYDFLIEVYGQRTDEPAKRLLDAEQEERLRECVRRLPDVLRLVYDDFVADPYEREKDRIRRTRVPKATWHDRFNRMKSMLERCVRQRGGQ